MVALPELVSPTAEAIYGLYEAREAKVRRRGHLGASKIGEECTRDLWYSFRWCARPKFSGRVLRLFQTGHLEEARIVADLRGLGMTVHENSPDNGEQFRFMTHGGHFGGSLDGVVLGVIEAPKTWHLVEMKTSNAKGFRGLKSKGVEEARPTHYAQMQTYMGLGDLTRSLYVAVCKDTDEIYAERVRFDKNAFEAIRAKALRIIQSSEPLTKISDKPDFFRCKWCDHSDLCHGDKVPEANCRTCVSSTPVVDGEGGVWRCERFGGGPMGHGLQESGCEEHLLIPSLVPFAKPVDGGEGWIAYGIEGREQCFINVSDGGFPAFDAPHYSSAELSKVNPSAIGDPVVEAARTVLDGETVG